jgi:hypothetical protein
MVLPRLISLLALALVVTGPGGGPAAAQEVTGTSPFLPSGGTAPAPQVEGGDHELVGIIATSRQTLVGITQRSTRKSLWIPLGRTVEGIEVVSCEPEHDRAVVRIAGELKTLVMRSGGSGGGGAPVPVASAPLPPYAPAVRQSPSVPTPAPAAASAAVQTPAQAEQEREARMLVSDLLEIGIQQRKAYEEAQRKNAQKAPAR